jgi:superfamily II DNA/RNA helicase
MPTIDVGTVEKWANLQAHKALLSRRYSQHFAELITRRLRLELSSERGEEPKYTHSLWMLEHTAHYFINAGLRADPPESTAYFHEAAVLFEQIADLMDYKNLPYGPDVSYRKNQALLAALAYYLGGYEANAIVLAGNYLAEGNIKKLNVYGVCAAFFLSKRFMDLRQYIYGLWHLGEIPAVDDFEDDSALGEFTYKAADRCVIRAAMSFLDFLRSGEQDEVIEAIHALSLSAQAYDACGDNVGSCIVRTLAKTLGILDARSLHRTLREYDSPTGLLARYNRLVFAGKKPVSELWRSQMDIGPQVLTTDENVVVSLPTSAGKTRLAELAIIRSLERFADKKAIYLVPTRALASEVEQTLGKNFGTLGFRVSALFGGYHLSDFERQIIDECHILVTTPEKCDLLIRSKDDFLSDVSLVICDEGHQVGSGDRGITYEFVLSRILWHAAKYRTRIIMLSAVLSNLDVVGRWLTTDFVRRESWKPTRTRLVYFLWRGNDGQLRFLDEELMVGTEFAFVPGVLDKRTAPKMRDGWIAHLSIHFAKVGMTLVFTPRPAKCEEIAKRIRNEIKRLGLETVSSHQSEIDTKYLPAIERIIGSGHELSKCLKFGVAFHHGQLPQAVRLHIENMVRDGLIPIAVANETLAQGVNLPIKVVVIDTLSRGGGLVSVRDFWNIAGRAGRAGREVEGYIVFVQPKSGDIQNYVFRYFQHGQFEPTSSILLSTICNALIPSPHNVLSKATEMAIYGGQPTWRFWPWLASIQLTVENAVSLLSLSEPQILRDALENELRTKLVPGYRWNRDPEHWPDVMMQALRNILLSDILPLDTIELTSDIWQRILGRLDSQLLATIVEDILANEEAINEFLKHTLFGAEVSTNHPLFKAFGKGLRERFLYIRREIPDEDIRKLFNMTGLSVAGNRMIVENLELLTEALHESSADQSKWHKALEIVLSVTNAIPDLLPEGNLERSLALILDWLIGRSLEEITQGHFEGNMGIAVRTIEREVVRKIPWGINAIKYHIKAIGFPVDDEASWLNSLPAMVGFGVPSPVAAFTASQGVQSRADCIAVAEAFSQEEGDESYESFVEWFCKLWERDDIQQILKNVADISFIITLSEQRARGYKGTPPKVTLKLDQNYGLSEDQEILFFPKGNGARKYQAMTTKYAPAFSVRFKKGDFDRLITEKDYIARYTEQNGTKRVEIQFV